MRQQNGVRRVGIRYSESFKMAVVRELEEGEKSFEADAGSVVFAVGYWLIGGRGEPHPVPLHLATEREEYWTVLE